MPYESLPTHDRAYGYDRLVLCHRRVGHAVRYEIPGQIGDAIADLVTRQGYGLIDGIGMKLLALGQTRR